MRAGLFLVVAGLLLSGCTNLGLGGKDGLLGGLTDNKEATSGTARPASGPPPARAWYAGNDNCRTWDQNAYHYECDPNANY
jgi:hypothetical protein